jgi:hypothetical protein
MNYYTYAYYDENWFPYYVGKGSKKRFCEDHGDVVVPPKNRILIQYWESEAKAFEMEKVWILLFGRQEFGGYLQNRDEGGRAPSKRCCRKGGLKGGKTTASRYFTPERQSLAGKVNVSSGLIYTIATPKSCGIGGLAHFQLHGNPATPESLHAGGVTAGRKRAESGAFNTLHLSGNHTKWHVNRGITKEGCVLCQ